MYIHTDPSGRIRRMRVRPIRGRPAPAYEANGIRNRDGWDVHVMSSPCVCALGEVRGGREGGLYAYSNRPGEGTCVCKGLVFHSPDRVRYTGYL